MDAQRRKFFSMVGLGVAASAIPVAAVGVAMVREKAKPLPTVNTGDIMRAESWNDLVQRVNEISERI